MISGLLIFIGLGEGLLVGSSVGIFFSVLGIITRLAQLTRTYDYLLWYSGSIILGTITVLSVSFYQKPWNLSLLFIPVLGILMGSFIGFLAAALAEVLNVIPFISRRLDMEYYLSVVFLFFILGKVAGALLYWIYFA